MGIRPTIRALLALTAAGAPACAPTQAAGAPAPVLRSSVEATAAPDTTRLTVTGTASVRIPSDRARLQVALETEAGTAAAASQANAEVMTRVLEAVRPAAGAGARIETSGYQLTPQYRQGPNRESPPEIAGYRAVNQLVVVLDEVGRAGMVLDAALGAGANRVTGLTFFASDTESARLEALTEATAHARAEASAVAAALGLTLLSPETVQTSTGGAAPVFRGLAMEAYQVMDTPVEAGTQTVDASVTITYRLLAGGSR